MPPRLRPVDHEARLTITEHLGELRTRIVISIAMIAVAFSFTYWQHNNILEAVNRPLVNSQQKTTDNSKNGDPILQGQRFDKAVAQSLDRLVPALEGLSSTTRSLPQAGTTQAQRRALQQRIRDVARATAALREASKIAPNASNRKPVTLGVTEPFFQTITVAGYAALVIVLPLLLYQLYAFLIPAFSTRERRAIVPMLLLVPLLFYAGTAFGYFLALPRAVDFLQNFNQDNFDVLVQAKDYFKFVALFLLGTGIVFQIPVVVLIVTRLGIISPKQLRKQRRLVILGAAVAAAIITPTPDPFTMLLVMTPLYLLFEGSVFIASILERRRGPRESRGWWDEEDDDEDDEDDDEDPGPDDDPTPFALRPTLDEDEDDHEDDGFPWDVDDVDDDDPDAWDDDEGTYEHDVAPPVHTGPRGEDPDPTLAGDPDGPRAPEPTLEHPTVGDDTVAFERPGRGEDDTIAFAQPDVDEDDTVAMDHPGELVPDDEAARGPAGDPAPGPGFDDDAEAEDTTAAAPRPRLPEPPPAAAPQPRPRTPAPQRPRGPRAPEEEAEPWWLAADKLDAEDPFADLEAGSPHRRRRPKD